MASISDHNAVVRTQNSLLTNAYAQFTPLHAPATNEVIPAFPDTPEEIDSTSMAPLNSILSALGQSVGGNLNKQRQGIRIAIGLTAVRTRSA
ncbi:hypothetical protein D0867_00292 [Hortaea werneckii]|uniref:Uncharacterized protein n=1 Tax=Hortaea werneckii TaxID=91943 RepID=A0A3M7BQH2_HORWE|nr:hypothetical protein D0867_00292 [Hortaea werneckii]RMY42062.1 hypothetical protein D0866_00169 [Hortaea werneckii]